MAKSSEIYEKPCLGFGGGVRELKISEVNFLTAPHLTDATERVTDRAGYAIRARAAERRAKRALAIKTKAAEMHSKKALAAR